MSHDAYSKIVKEELKKLIKSKGGSVDAEDLLEFGKNIEAGKDCRGKEHKQLKAFNDGIRAERQAYLDGGRGRGFRNPPTTVKDYIDRGRSFLSQANRFGETNELPPAPGRSRSRPVLGATLASILGSLLAENVQASRFLDNHAGFQQAKRLLHEGKLDEASEKVWGPGTVAGGTLAEGIPNEMVREGMRNAASDLIDRWANALECARQREAELFRKLQER